VSGKTFRCYYNRCEDAPQIWSVDEGDQTTEINVIDWRSHGCAIASGLQKGVPTTSKQVPKVWASIFNARLVVEKGVAHFYPVEAHGGQA
jgi:hypothetical protein